MLQQEKLYAERKFERTAAVNVYDNCVGQNKSNVCMQFQCLVSVLLNIICAMLFFLPGHSHTRPDHCWAWCKRRLKLSNLHLPNELVEKFNQVPSIHAELLTPSDAGSPFRKGWGPLLAKHFYRIEYFLPEIFPDFY